MTNIRNDKKIFILVLTVALIVFFATAFAWFATAAQKAGPRLTANTRYIQTYFAGGTGTADDPYLLSEAKHVSNLQWLQYMGYFNQKDTLTNEITPVYFKMTNDISMGTWWNLPIGTTKYPFVGNFNGDGHRLYYITIFNQEGNRTDDDVKKKYCRSSSGKATDTCLIPTSVSQVKDLSFIGVFGVVGNFEGSSSDAATNYEFSSSYDSQTGEGPSVVRNVVFSDVSIQVYNSKSVAGIIGYLNGHLDNVICDGSPKTSGEWLMIQNNKGSECYDADLTTNLSDYYLVGYCADHDYCKKSLKKTVAEVEKPDVENAGAGSQGGGTAWGDSVSMNDLNTRLNAMHDRASSYTYKSGGKIYRKDGNVISVEEGTTQKTDSRIKHYHNAGSDGKDDVGGSVAFTGGRWISSYYNTLYGEKLVPTSEASVTIIDEVPAGSFAIASGTGDSANYIKATESGITNVTAASLDMTYWMFTSTAGTLEDNGYIQTTLGNDYYYLYRKSDGTLGVTKNESDANVWTYSSTNKSISTIVSGTTYYIVFENSTWKTNTALSNEKFYISDGNGYYMCAPSDMASYSSTGQVSGTKDISKALKWEKSGSNLKTTYNGKTFYMYRKNDSSSYVYMNTSSKSSVNLGADSLMIDSYYIVYKGGYWGPNTSGKENEFILSANRNGTTYYLKDAGTGTSSKTPVGTTNKDEATVWISSNYDSNGKPTETFFSKADRGRRLYIWNNGQSLTVGTSVYKTWKWNTTYANKLGDGTGWLNYSGSWNTNTNAYSASDITVTSIRSGTPKVVVESLGGAGDIQRVQSGEHKEMKTTENAYLSPKTVIPINASTTYPFAPSENNPGYILSGGSSDTNNTITNQGDIRVSLDYFGYDNLTYSNNSQSSYTTETRKWLQALTYDTKTNSYVRIKDDYNKSDINTTHSAISGFSVKSYSELGLQMYEGARKRLDATFKAAGANTHAFQFRDAPVSMDVPFGIVTVDKAKIGGQVYTDYQMPQHSIDFKASSNGYVAFFAGSYFKDTSSGKKNDSFFSLNQIFRNSEDPTQIDEIKEIVKIYKATDTSIGYVYEYSDGTFSSGTKASDTPVFDMSIIQKRPQNELLQSTDSIFGILSSTYAGALYYYEIPIKSGEYALGSVEGGTGCYFEYLDIGSSSIGMKKTVEKTKVTTKSNSYPYGIDLQSVKSVSAASSFDDPSATISISVGNLGTQNFFSREGNTVTATGGMTSSKYVRDGVTLQKGSTTINPAPEFTDTEITEKKTETETNTTTKRTESIITEYKNITHQEGSGTPTTTKTGEKYQVVTHVDETTGEIITDDPVPLDPPEDATTHTIAFGTDIILKYHYSTDSIAENVFKLLSGETQSGTVTGEYEIEVTTDDTPFDILVDIVQSSFSDSRLNGTTMVEGQTIKSKTKN